MTCGARCIYLDTAAMQHVAAATGLQLVSLQGCERVTDEGLQHIAALPLLSTLAVRACPYVTCRGLSYLAERQTLTS